MEFTTEQIERLSNEIDQQLQGIVHPSLTFQKGEKDKLIHQKEAITTLTREPANSFLQKFAKAAKSDLCEENGVLYQQWKKWADLNNKEVIEKFSAVLVTLGFSGQMLEILVVSTAVIVLHIGVKAFCEEYNKL